MDKLHVSDVEAAGAAGVSLKNITLHRGPDGALLDGYFLRDAEGRWTYTGGLRTGDEVAQVAGLRMSPWAGTALDEVLRRVQAEPFKLVQSGDEFYIDGLPSGPATVLRSTAEDDDAPGLVRAHLADHPLIGGNGPTMHAAAVSVLHSLRKNAADPIGWLRHVRPARAPRRARGRDRQGHPRRRAGRGRRPLPGRVVRGQGDRPPGVAPARRGRHGRRPLAPPDRHDMPQETAP